jgi:hypothetical protein
MKRRPPAIAQLDRTGRQRASTAGAANPNSHPGSAWTNSTI